MSDVDLIVRGTIYDGSGRPPKVGDVAIRSDRIAAVGDVGRVAAHHVIDADGLAVAPGFINMMSWSNESLIEDGASQSEIRQGVTLEVMGEGWSMGPATDEMKAEIERRGAGNPLVDYAVEWTTLGQYLGWLERRGISPNVASFVGASTVRIHAMGYEARRPTEEELDRMRVLVRGAMAEGARRRLGPDLSAGDLLDHAGARGAAAAAAEFGGMYASHIRSEGAALIEAVEEVLEIARLANVRAEIYHLKASGRTNWPKMDGAIEMIEAARASGHAITADAYPYVLGHRPSRVHLPPWAHEGGFDELLT